MMQALFETIFDVCYLVGVLIIGFTLCRNGRTTLVRRFGLMAIVLGAGDAFHLIPRIWALWGSGLEANAAALGIGKLITSITMTLFYMILYAIWRERYGVTGRKGLTITLWVLAALRVVLCLLPQNEWLTYPQPQMFGILRNIPFAAIGVILIVLFAQEVRRTDDRVFRFMSLAITLSFAFYIPVVLFADTIPLLGMLMVPKTLAYVWIIWMGFTLHRQTTE